MKNHILYVSFSGLILLFSCSSLDQRFPELSGPYLGQAAPDSLPEIFAPGIIGTGIFTRDMAISPDGKEIYYCVGIGNYNYATIMHTKEINGKWTQPTAVPFAESGKIFDFEPGLTPDGNRMYFLSTRPDGNEEAGDQDIWYVDRYENGWGEPVNPGAPLNTDGGEFFPSVTKDKWLYFTHNDAGSGLNQIFRSKIYSDSLGTPELLPPQVNCGRNQFNAFVAPDHDYVIVPAVGREDAYDQADYYITFRNTNDQWSDPQNLGPAVNEGNTRGWSPYVSPDGKYFFFMSNKSEDVAAEDLNWENLQEIHNKPGNGNSNIYWMKADFISELRAKAVFLDQ